MSLVSVNPYDPISVKRAIHKLARKLGPTGAPTHAELTITGLTASRIIATDVNKKLVSLADPLIVAKGGTGVATLTDHGILLGSGTDAITPLGVASNGQIPIGSAGADPVLAAITGTENQITVTNAAGSITLSTPQDIHTGATPTFAGLISTDVVQATDFAKTGWPITVGATFSFSYPTFTVTDGGSAYYYVDGVKYILGGNKTVDITDTEGRWYIYFDGATLTASQTIWSFSAEDKALVAILYWDAVNNKEIFLGWEPHTFHMSGVVHARLHYAGGTRWESGLLVSDAGSEQVNVSAGDIWDEDLNIPISDGAGSSLFEQVLSPAELPIYYRDGAEAWRIFETTDKANAIDAGYVNGSNDLCYNELNGVWAVRSAGAAKYVAYFVIASNDQTEPVALIMGQRIDTTLAAAKENNIFSGLSLSGMPFEELIVLARLILKVNAGSPYYTLEDITDLRSLNIAGNVTSPLITDHGGLGGLGDDDHPQYVLKSLFDAHTILYATTDDTPVALSVTEQTLVGRLTGGNISAVTIGIADNNIVQIDSADVADDEYARFTENGLEGRTEAEFKADFNLEIGTDVLAQQTIGIADDNLLEVDDADAADNDYAKFTTEGLEGRSYAEVLTDLSGQAGSAFDFNSQNITGIAAITATSITLSNTGLHILDTNASHDLIVAPGSDLTADRTLTLTTGDSARTITLSGNPTLADWFDQSVKTTATPTFAGILPTGNVDLGTSGDEWTQLWIRRDIILNGGLDADIYFKDGATEKGNIGWNGTDMVFTSVSGKINFGNDELYTTGTITANTAMSCKNFTLKAGQFCYFDARSNDYVTMQGQDTSSPFGLELYAKDKSGQLVAFTIWKEHNGDPDNINPGEYIQIASDNSPDEYFIKCAHVNSSLKPLVFRMQADEVFKLGIDGGIHAVLMKTGTTQANAGAAAGELWADTDDANTVKLGT